ncbi:hypothetical protein PLESTB_000682300 [Pleodorina starrii]|uniref:ATP-dependent RNA helicase n=1 Tax=Pleodorina starrii TaxID=330485 RepID=A0A9W6BIP1_9CHLO|nr:hypothetical protein PLESTB_000682300 [Pleodorina starrii]
MLLSSSQRPGLSMNLGLRQNPSIPLAPGARYSVPAGQSRVPLTCHAATGSAPAAGLRRRSLQLQRREPEEDDQTSRPVQPKIMDATTTSFSTDEDVPLPPMVDQQYLSDTKFVDFDISSNSKRALVEVLRYERCSLVQAAAIPVCLGPADVVAKAKTGTGKTLAFVIPAIEKVLADRAPRGKVSVLVLSPTRELARQIGAETSRMLSFHPGLHSMVVYGGVNPRSNLREMMSRMPDILIATPGRCWDLMNNPGLQSMLSAVRLLVLDEADNLLDMGFRPQIASILRGLPPTPRRQTFLFSATFPPDVNKLAGVALKRQHEYVDAVGRGEVATHGHVEASCRVVPLECLRGQLLALMALHMAQEPQYKIIVFLPTAHLTAYLAELFVLAGLKKSGLVAIHSRMAQSGRDRASAAFRGGSRQVLFSSDVSARGVDYPGVTLVIQVGAPSSRDQYIHRAGRTGRAGRPGQCTLLLADFEEAFLTQLADLPITRINQPLQLPPPLQQQQQGQQRVDAPMSEGLVREPERAFARAAERIDAETRLSAFKSVLGYYRGHQQMRFSSRQLVDIINGYAVEVMSCPSPPPLSPHFAKKMGVHGVPGLVMSDPAQEEEGQEWQEGEEGEGAGGRGRRQRGGSDGGGGGGGGGSGRRAAAEVEAEEADGGAAATDGVSGGHGTVGGGR